MNEKETWENRKRKELRYNIFIFIMFVAITCILFCTFGNSRFNDGQNVDESISNLKKQQQQITDEYNHVGVIIDRTEKTFRETAESIDKLKQGVTAAERETSEIRKGIDDCQKILGECRSITDENRRIFNAVERGN